MSADQVWQLARAVDDLKVPVMCYGLRVDFQGSSFQVSSTFGIGGRDARDTHHLPLREKGDDGRATGRTRKRVERRRAGTSWRK